MFWKLSERGAGGFLPTRFDLPLGAPGKWIYLPLEKLSSDDALGRDNNIASTPSNFDLEKIQFVRSGNPPTKLASHSKKLLRRVELRFVTTCSNRHVHRLGDMSTLGHSFTKISRKLKIAVVGEEYEWKFIITSNNGVCTDKKRFSSSVFYYYALLFF